MDRIDENSSTSRTFAVLQDDKDFVHEFVNNQGLQCLIKIGQSADQHYQNYILRGKIPMSGVN